jgi:hypothetical protein
MLERGSRAALIGRWGMALTLVTGAVLIGRLIRNFPISCPTGFLALFYTSWVRR